MYLYRKYHNQVFVILIILLYEWGVSQEIDIHGFISQGYIKSSANNYLSIKCEEGSFEFNEAGINFSVQLTDELRGGIQLLSRDIGDQGNNRFSLDWAYADYHFRDYLGVRAGKIKTPLGLYNEGRDVDALRTCILLPQSVYDETIRDFTFAFQGASMYGNMRLGFLGSADYQAYLGTYNIPNPRSGFWRMAFEFLGKSVDELASMEAGSGTPVESEFCNTAVHGENLFGGALIWETPVSGLRLGGSFMRARLEMEGDYKATADHKMELMDAAGQTVQFTATQIMSRNIWMDVDVPHYYTLSAEYMWNNLLLAGEYHAREYHVDIHGLSPFAISEIKNMVLDFEGYYGMITYRLFPWLEAGLYYSVFNDTDNGRETDESLYKLYQKDASGFLRFDITDRWLVKFEQHIFDGATQVYEYENRNRYKEEDWSLYAVKTSLSF
ncbi:hypothetical protein JW835_04615 [bacterium]|nr:hypothetical protein [bacterium]